MTGANNGEAASAKKEDLAPIYPDFATGVSQALKQERVVIIVFRDKSAFTTQMEAEVRQLVPIPYSRGVFLFADRSYPTIPWA
jgi:thiamine monophosphate synthase